MDLGKLDVPRHEFFDSIDGVVGNPGEHVGQVSFWIDPVQFRSSDQAIHRGGTRQTAKSKRLHNSGFKALSAVPSPARIDSSAKTCKFRTMVMKVRSRSGNSRHFE